MALTVVPVYAALLAVGYIYLASRVIRARRAERVAIGTGGNPRVERAMRAHANFVEYTPFALLLIAFVETMGGPWWVVHPLALVLVAARAAHAYGISRTPEDFRYRVRGMAGTLGVIGTASLAIAALSIGAALGAGAR